MLLSKTKTENKFPYVCGELSNKTETDPEVCQLKIGHNGRHDWEKQDIEFFSDQELLTELLKRHSCMIFMGEKILDRVRLNFNAQYCGSPSHALGLGNLFVKKMEQIIDNELGSGDDFKCNPKTK